MSIFDRQGMDDSRNELAGEELPERNHGAALSIEESSRLNRSADLDALDAAGSLTGMTIGHYLVGERLGGGAMATVYRAQDQILDRSLAIKVLLPGADGVMQARFRREAAMVSKLVHPHIVRTLQVGRSGAITYIAMELVEGASLGELLERYGKLSVADAARILSPVAEALAYAHDHGIIHRDVKPSNILLQRAAMGSANSVVTGLLPYPVIPLLSDFGIARALDAPELTSAGRTIGTPAFMAPEQCAGSADIDGRADVYALGAVFYRCLVGRAPFAGTTTQILHAHVYDPLLIPDDVADALPAPAVRILARAMMKEPSQRYANVSLMATELESVSDLPVPPAVKPSTELADPTMTMASVPVVQSPTTVTFRVLVPAPSSTPPRISPLKSIPRAPAPGTTPVRTIPVAPLPTARRRSHRSRWGVMALGGAFVVLVVLLAATLFNSMIPGIGEDDPEVGNATSTPVAVAEGGTSQPAVVVPDVSPDQTITSVVPSQTSNTPVQNGLPAAEVRPTNAVTTPMPIPPPSVPLPYAWEQALSFYDDGDWDDAVTWLIMVRRIINGPDPLYLLNLK